MEKKNELAKKEQVLVGAIPKDYSDQVMNSIKQFTVEKRLQLPKNYSAENSLKSAWLQIQQIKGAENCTPKSVANALLEMVIMGLNPAKSQCYFITYGTVLTCFPSYFGRITALKRIEGFESINAQVIYEGDEIDYEMNSDGSISNIEHHQEFKNIKEDKIIGGYCVIRYKGQDYGTISTMEQIQEAWNKSTASKQKKEFKSEFVKRTMVNKAVKWFVNTRDDEDLLIETITTNENQHYDFEEKDTEPEAKTVVILEPVDSVVDNTETKKDLEFEKVEKNDTKIAEFE